MVMEMVEVLLGLQMSTVEVEEANKNRRKDRRVHGPCGGKEGGLNHGVQVSLT